MSESSAATRFTEALARALRPVPEFTEPEQWYLSGLMEGLKHHQASPQVPVVPASAPLVQKNAFGWMAY